MQIVLSSETLPTLPKHERDYRAPGVHVSQIIHDICVTLDPDRFSRGDGKDGSDEFDLEENPKVWLGQAADAYLKRMLRGIAVTGIERDGVQLSSDLVALHYEPPRPGLVGDPDDHIVEEIKLTWMSLRQGIEDKKFVHWLWQLKGYCWAWETCRGRLRVFAVNGRYAPPTPIYQVFDVLFTYRELEDNWRMLVGHARKRGWL